MSCGTSSLIDAGHPGPAVGDDAPTAPPQLPADLEHSTGGDLDLDTRLGTAIGHVEILSNVLQVQLQSSVHDKREMEDLRRQVAQLAQHNFDLRSAMHFMGKTLHQLMIQVEDLTQRQQDVPAGQGAGTAATPAVSVQSAPPLSAAAAAPQPNTE